MDSRCVCIALDHRSKTGSKSTSTMTTIKQLLKYLNENLQPCNWDARTGPITHYSYRGCIQTCRASSTVSCTFPKVLWELCTYRPTSLYRSSWKSNPFTERKNYANFNAVIFVYGYTLCVFVSNPLFLLLLYILAMISLTYWCVMFRIPYCTYNRGSVRTFFPHY